MKIPMFLKVNFFTYLLIYFIKSFILFELTNPFFWIVNLPIYTNNERIQILFILAFYYTIIFFITAFITADDKE